MDVVMLRPVMSVVSSSCSHDAFGDFPLPIVCNVPHGASGNTAMP